MTSNINKLKFVEATRKIALMFFFLLFSPFLFSHGIVNEQIEALNHKINQFDFSEEEETSLGINRSLAMLYFERGQLYQQEKYFDAAFHDYNFLLYEHKKMEIVLLAMAELFLEHDFFHLSLVYIDKFLEKKENNIKALECKAKIHYALGDYDESIAIYEYIISFAQENLVLQHFIALSKTLQKRNLLNDNLSALKCLQRGINVLGGLASLQDVYVEIAIETKQYNEALVKIDELLSQDNAFLKVKLLLKKAEINLLFNCYSEVIFFYKKALHNMTQLSTRHTLMNRECFLKFRLLCDANNFQI